MNNNSIPLITDAVLNMPWAILPPKLLDILSVLHSKEHGELLDDEKLEAKVEAVNNADKRYIVEDEIAIVPIYGILSKRFNIISALSGGTSYELLEKDIRAALSDNDVKGLFLDVDSPGGAVDGMVDVTDVVYNARNGKKPIMTFANGLMASAAYHIGSAADYIVAANSTTQVGSIGVVMAPHFDYSKKYEKDNIKVTMFYSGKYKMTLSKYKPVSKDDKKYVQDRLDYLYSLFVDTTAKHRGTTPDVVNSDMAEGKIFIGSQSVDAGLTDEVLNRQGALNKLQDVISGRESFNRKPVVKRRASTRTESKGGKTSMQTIKNYDLKSLAENIQSCENIDALKAVENQCLTHFAAEAKTAENWIVEEKTKSTSNHVKQLVDIRRRQLLALPQIQKAHADYELGMAVGKR
jgi:signal peptide peptidase SppA